VVELLVHKDLTVSLVETVAVKDLAALEVEMLVYKDLAVSLVETAVVKDLAALEVEMLVYKDLAVSLVEMVVVRDLLVLETVLDLESHQLEITTMVLTRVVIFLLYPENPVPTTQYYQRYQILHLLVTKDYQVTTLILKPDVKYSIYVLMILNTTFCVLMEQYSTNNTLYVSGGTSLIVQLLKVYMA